jgi:hypothetical protein
MTQNKTNLNKVTSSLQNSKYAKYARQAFNTAINDLKTGDFNHPGGGFGFDDSDD